MSILRVWGDFFLAQSQNNLPCKSEPSVNVLIHLLNVVLTFDLGPKKALKILIYGGHKISNVFSKGKSLFKPLVKVVILAYNTNLYW